MSKLFIYLSFNHCDYEVRKEQVDVEKSISASKVVCPFQNFVKHWVVKLISEKCKI